MTFRALEKLLTGDLPEPAAARGVEKAAIRVIYRVAKLAGLKKRAAPRRCFWRGSQRPSQAAVELGASDIHLKPGRPPVLRRDGALGDMEKAEALTTWDMEDILTTVSRPDQVDAFHATGDLDLAYQVAGLPRFRVNAFRQRDQIGFAFRVISTFIPSFEELGLPRGVERLANEPRGLVLVTGATGSGKTTTLAAMVDHINRTRRDHVLTIEDPIEIIHQEQRGVISQREVGLDTGSFGEGLRRALRQDPDVILIGELRDAETAQVALQAAESGHIVLSTLHTVDAAESCGRIIEFFPPEKQEVIRSILAGVLRGVVSQRLLPRADGGRIPAVEVMVMNARIADLIREGVPTRSPRRSPTASSSTCRRSRRR